jgi:HPr kinase/phosphorylase
VSPSSPPGATVGAFLRSHPESAGLPLELVAGAEGLDRVITSPYIQKTGLALAGFDEYLRPGRILIFGESEIRFLESLAPEPRATALAHTLARDIPCVVMTGGFDPPPELPLEAENAGVPLLATPLTTPSAIAKLTAMLEDTLAERTVIHAVLMDILGLGVLIVGESGIGKSECALDLIVRGHRLVADDTVELRRRAESYVIGTCPELTRNHMEVRGLGVINIKDPGLQYERLGLDDQMYEIMDVGIPLIRMPVAPGRNVAILVEVAARNQLLRSRGHHAARRFAARLERQLRSPSPDAAEIEDAEEDG